MPGENRVAEKEKAEQKQKEDKQPERKETPSETIASFAATFVVGLFIITFIMQLFTIPSGSMEQTLLIGDYVFVDRLTPTAKAGYVGPLIPYRPLQHGDIVVFLKPSEPGLHLVKRVMGLPGDRIHLHNGVVYRNGQPLTEPYTSHDPGSIDAARDEFPSDPLGLRRDSSATDWPLEIKSYIQGEDLVVPADSYFVMGDNRDNSLDSRFWGFVPRANVVGRPLFVLWSLDTPGSGPSQTLGDRAKYIGYAIRHFFDKTRWKRSFHPVR